MVADPFLAVADAAEAPQAGVDVLDPDIGPTWHERQVAAAVADLRVRAEARERYEVERAGLRRPIAATFLCDVPDDPVRWRVDGLLPVGGRMVVVAARKAGKTTICLNLAGDMLTGGRFLGRFDVSAVERVGFLNFEVSDAQLARWARDVDMAGDRFVIVGLRGHRSPFADAAGRAELAAVLRRANVDVLLVDPFSRAFTGTSQNDASEVAAWLARLDELAVDAGIGEVVLTVHAGWSGERSRGSSGLEDWPDAVTYLTRDVTGDDPDGRWFSAIGRDVDVAEDRLDFDPSTRRLSLTGSGSRATGRDSRRFETLVELVHATVAARPGLSTTALGEAVREAGGAFQRGDIGRAARQAADDGLIVAEQGKRNAVHWHPTGQKSRVVPSGPRSVVSGPDPSLRDGTTQGLLEDRVVPNSEPPRTDLATLTARISRCATCGLAADPTTGRCHAHAEAAS